MARDDTRLHRLEAMVAGLLAWQNVAEKRLKDLEMTTASHTYVESLTYRIDDLGEKLEALGDCRLPARVAELEQHCPDCAACEGFQAMEEFGARVAALEQQLASADHWAELVNHLRAKRVGGPEPAAAPAQAAYRDWACDECVKGIQEPDGEWSRCKDGRCNIVLGGIDFCPKQAAQHAPQQPRGGGG